MEHHFLRRLRSRRPHPQPSRRAFRLGSGAALVSLAMGLLALSLVSAGAVSSTCENGAGQGVDATHQKCINTDANDTAISPYSGWIYLKAGTASFDDEFADHAPSDAQFKTVTGDYELVLTLPDNSVHTYDYSVTGNANTYPTPNGPTVDLGFTVASDETVQYTLYINGTVRSDANSVRNQIWLFDADGGDLGQAATKSVMPAAPAPIPSPSPSPTESASPSPSPTESVSPESSPSPSPSESASPSPSPTESVSPAASPSPTGGTEPTATVSPSGGGQGQGGVQAATTGQPNTGISIWSALLGLACLAVGLRLLWIARTPRRA